MLFTIINLLTGAKASPLNFVESFLLGTVLFFVIYFDLDDFILIYTFVLQIVAFRYFILKEGFYQLNLIIYFGLSTFVFTQLIIYSYQYFAILSPRVSVNPYNAIFLLILLPILFYSISKLQMNTLQNSTFSFRFSLGFFNGILMLVVIVINVFRNFSIDLPFESSVIMLYSFTLAFIVIAIGLLGLYLINKQQKRFQKIQDEITQLSLDKFDIERARHNRNNILFTIHFYLEQGNHEKLQEYIQELNLED